MKMPSLRRSLALTSILAATAILAVPASGFSQAFPGPIVAPPIRIVSPADHSLFHGPVDLPIFAYVEPRADIAVSNVEFFANGKDLGSGIRLGASNSAPPVYASLALRSIGPGLGSLYGLVWSNAPVGRYLLTAVAEGRGIYTPTTSISRTSPPVEIVIVGSITNTNAIDVVSILATDPIAVSGTNSSVVWQGAPSTALGWTNWPPTRWQNYTNWGPKAGLFTVRRCGPIANNLRVMYQIGGTASNGVDYATLPGYVEIPAGSVAGLIPIIPIDRPASSAAPLPKTVILTLVPDPTAQPASTYIVGVPRRAEVVILPRWLRRPIPLADGSFCLTENGPDGAWFAVQTSTDMKNWFTVCTNQVLAGSINFVDPDAAGTPTKFYRAVPMAGPPLE